MKIQNRYRNCDVMVNRPLLNNVERLGRSAGRFLPHYDYDRIDGVSAITLIRDEPLAFDSIKGILPLVDEVVVVDCSNIESDIPNSDKIVYVHTPPEQDSQFKIGMLLSHHRWLLRWDGDFLVVDKTKEFIKRIRLIKDGYWQIKSLVANVHNDRISFLQKEQYAFTYHPSILVANYTWLKKMNDMVSKICGGFPGRICYGMLPYFFGQMDFDVVFAEHHYKSKSVKRLLERKFQAQWSVMTDKKRSEFKGFEDYVEKNK